MSTKRLVINLATAVILMTTTNNDIGATPFHEKPQWWTATVNGRDALNEQYGPFKSPETAAKFCTHIPKMYVCKVAPILPPVEWMRKGAR